VDAAPLRAISVAISVPGNAKREQIMQDNEHFSPDEANSYLKTGDPKARRGGGRTLARWRREGTGPAFLRLPGRIVYRKRDLDEWLERRRVVPVRERGTQ
jgi:hypothetical protein